MKLLWNENDSGLGSYPNGCKGADTVYSVTHNHKQNMHLSFTLRLKLLQKAGQISGFNSCKINNMKGFETVLF